MQTTIKIKTKSMEHQKHDDQCSTQEPESKKSHKNFFNADFLFLLITGVVLNAYALTYAYAFYG